MTPPLAGLTEMPAVLRALVDESKDGVVVVGRDGVIEEANSRAAGLVGMTRAEVVGVPFDRFFETDLRERATECFASATKRHEVLVVAPLEGEAGRTVDVELRARRMEDGRILAFLRDASDLRRHQRALRIVSAALSESSDQPFFEALVRALARALPIDYAFVGELVEPERTRVKLYALVGPDGPEEAIEYDLESTPCGVAARERRRIFTSTAQEDFPDDAMLVEMGIRTYQAIPLFDAEGTVVGLLGILDREATEEDPLTTSMLDLVASRASAEIGRQRTERERRRAERHLRALVHASSRFVWGVDAAGQPTLDLADTWFEKTGQRVDATVDPLGWLDAILPEDRERVRAEWEAAFREQREFEVQYPVRTAEETRHLKVRGIPIDDEDGEFEGFIGTFDDVTELRRAAEDLKRRNDMLRLLRAVPEATHNGAGFIESIQVGLSEICRSSPFELGRLRMQGDFFGAFEDTGLLCGLVSKEAGREGLVSPLDTDPELARQVESSTAPVWIERMLIERRGGETHPHRRNGGPKGLRDAGDAGGEGDPWSGPCTAVFVPVRFGDEPVALLELLASSVVEQDETLMEVLSQIAIQLGRSWERDESQRQMREAERKARESQKLEAVGRLAGGIAHDFNNLLMVMLGEAELALLAADLPEPLRGSLEEIRTSGRRAAALTSQLLAFSRRGIESPERVELGQLIREAERMLRRVIGENVELDTSGVPDDESYIVEVTAGLIEQVVLNLVVNAREAMPGGGTIRVGLAKEHVTQAEATALASAEPGDYVVVSVRDEGVGIPEEIEDNIFEPFFTTKEDGSGFGLSTSYGIVTSAGGFIEVDSEVGVGSEFRVYLPLVETDASRSAEAVEGEPEPRAPGRVLVVEDDDGVRSVATRILSMAGYDVTATSGGAGVADYIRSGKAAPDVLLTDCVLRNETGLDIDDMVRQAFPEVGTVFMSGYTDDVLLRQGVHPEGGAFLPKPFSPEALVDAIERVFSEARGGANERATIDSGLPGG